MITFLSRSTEGCIHYTASFILFALHFKYNTMKILILGCNGQLGKDCNTVLSPEHDIVNCDITTCTRTRADISKKESVDNLIANHMPEIIINCAAYTAVDKCETEAELAWKVNADGPRNIAQAATTCNAKLIHISTDYVFDGKKQIPQPYTENDPVSPLGQYGKSKLAGEEAVQEYCSSHLILRTAWLYSAHGPNFLKTMLRLALQDKRREIKVVDDQYGSLTWSYTLALQIQALLDTELTGIIHATAEGYSTWYKGACYFLDKMDVPYKLAPCTTAEYPTPATRPSNSILENKKLKQVDLNLFQDWRDDIDLYVDTFKDTLLAEAAAQ